MRNYTRLYIVMFVLVFCLNLVSGAANRPPTANAGPSRYVCSDAVTLDGRKSYDPDGDGLTFHWRQVSGPAVVIAGGDTATPEVGPFTPTDDIQQCVFQLTVSDGRYQSEPQEVTVFIVRDYGINTVLLGNPPFRPDRPTLITFGGGNCDCSGLMFFEFPSPWYDSCNVISLNACYPYTAEADMLLVYLSEHAPEYGQYIQTAGFSTGGNPAILAANYLNGTYNDPRYAVNHVTFLDAPCPEVDFFAESARFQSNPVGGEPAWIDSYRVNAPFLPGVLDVIFGGAAHSIPPSWFDRSALPESWAGENMYNNGISGGFYYSVAGPGKHLRLPQGETVYRFKWIGGKPPRLEQRDPANYTARLPQPVELTGPEDGAVIGAAGAVFSCKPGENVVSYELLMGSQPDRLDLVMAETTNPPEALIRDLPFNPAYWAVRVRDASGATLRTEARSVFQGGVAQRPRVLFATAPGDAPLSGTVELPVRVTDNAGTYHVRFYIDGRLRHIASQPPWTYSWDTVSNIDTSHTVKVVALSKSGTEGILERKVEVKNLEIQLTATRQEDKAWMLRRPYIRLQATASFNAPGVEVSHYILHKRLRGSTPSVLSEIDPPELNGGTYEFTDTELTPGLEYIYTIEARGARGQTLALSPGVRI